MDSLSPAATVYVRGLAAEHELAQIRRLATVQERKEARRQLRAQRYHAASVRLRQLDRPLTEEERWEKGCGGIAQALAIVHQENEEEAAIQAAASASAVLSNLPSASFGCCEVQSVGESQGTKEFWENFVTALDSAQHERASAPRQKIHESKSARRQSHDGDRVQHERESAHQQGIPGRESAVEPCHREKTVHIGRGHRGGRKVKKR